jgi:membrane-bound metal-dependent hydrolase YbcI (DUF457 family)
VRGRTHALTGGAAWIGTMALTMPPAAQPLVFGTALAMHAACMPDLDQAWASVRPVSETAARIVRAASGGGHRHGTHSLLALGIVAVTAWLPVWLAGWPAWFALSITTGWAAHLATDSMTVAGCPWAWPLTLRSCWLLPRPLRITTGGKRRDWGQGLPLGEWLVTTLAALGMAAACILGSWHV